MISKNKIKYIRSLGQKKNRDAENVFIAEGPKVVGDLMGYFDCLMLLGTKDYLENNSNKIVNNFYEITQKELEQISQLKAPRDVFAIFSKTRIKAQEHPDLLKDLILVLDDVQDPGNLGTIIRIADWFGVKHIICSLHSADAFSPKVVQATMGALARVNITYTSINEFLEEINKSIPVYGTYLDGENIYSKPLTPNGIIVMGNEGNGIHKDLEKFITNRLYLPNYPVGVKTSESLNVAVATAITCAEFRRRM